MVVATPANLHVEMATAALKAGKHVLIEKPLSINLKGTERLVEIRNRKGLIAVVGYIHRSIPALRSVRSFLDTGKFGEPLLVTAISGQHFPHHRPAYKEIYFADHKTGGGTIQDAMTHLLNAVEWLVGPIETVYCDAAHQLLEGVEVEDTVNLLARSGRTLINCSYNLFQAPNEVRFEVHSEGGSLKAEYHKQRWGRLHLERRNGLTRTLPSKSGTPFLFPRRMTLWTKSKVEPPISPVSKKGFRLCASISRPWNRPGAGSLSGYLSPQTSWRSQAATESTRFGIPLSGVRDEVSSADF